MILGALLLLLLAGCSDFSLFGGKFQEEGGQAASESSSSVAAGDSTAQEGSLQALSSAGSSAFAGGSQGTSSSSFSFGGLRGSSSSTAGSGGFDWASCVALGTCGTLADLRPAATKTSYRRVRIGAQRWMAENLNFGTRVSNATFPTRRDASADSAQKYCYANVEANCLTEGAFYDWHSALGLPAQCDEELLAFDPCRLEDDGTHRGICPEGWHVPARPDWEALVSEVATLHGDTVAAVGADLRSNHDWLGQAGQGNDRFGFGALPTGHLAAPSYTDRGTASYFWSTEVVNLRNAAVWYISGNGGGLLSLPYADRVRYGYSLRCVADLP